MLPFCFEANGLHVAQVLDFVEEQPKLTLCVFSPQEKYKLLDPQRRKSVRCEIRFLVKAVNLCPREAIKARGFVGFCC